MAYVSVKRFTTARAKVHVLHVTAREQISKMKILKLRIGSSEMMMEQFFSVSLKRERKQFFDFTHVTKRPCWWSKQYNFVSQNSLVPSGETDYCS